VSCTHRREGREIAIAVADTGIGIAEADHTRIFEAFSQAGPERSRETGGTGLGLAICRRIATVLGGRLSLESKPREGSTFTFFLPLETKRR
jgi:signal transduction histidine kinase